MGLETFGDFLGGFNEGSASIRQRNQHEADLQAERENKIFDALVKSDDPDIRAAAVTGLLTKNHPAGHLAKFFDKMQQHPSYETIKGLVANGHQAFLGETEQTRRTTMATAEGNTLGHARGGAQALQEITGTWPDEATGRRMVLGSMGAAEPNTRLQHGTFFDADGTVYGVGSFNPETNEYAVDGLPMKPGLRFSSSGAAASTGAGGRGPAPHYEQMTFRQFKQQYPDAVNTLPAGTPDDAYVKVGLSQAPNTMGERLTQTLVAGPPPNYTGYTAGTDLYRMNSRTGATSIAGRGMGAYPATAPATTAAMVQSAIQQLVSQYGEPKSYAPGIIDPTPAQTAQVNAARDAAAAAYKIPGVTSFADLRALQGSAMANAGANTPQIQPAQPPPSLPPAPGKAGSRGARPPAGKGPAPGAPTAPPDSSDPLGLFR